MPLGAVLFCRAATHGSHRGTSRNIGNALCPYCAPVSSTISISYRSPLLDLILKRGSRQCLPQRSRGQRSSKLSEFPLLSSSAPARCHSWHEDAPPQFPPPRAEVSRRERKRRRGAAAAGAPSPGSAPGLPGRAQAARAPSIRSPRRCANSSLSTAGWASCLGQRPIAALDARERPVHVDRMPQRLGHGQARDPHVVESRRICSSSSSRDLLWKSRTRAWPAPRRDESNLGIACAADQHCVLAWNTAQMQSRSATRTRFYNESRTATRRSE